ncbi:MAG: DUF4131 domain-containing protein, partial [Nitrospinota bacterium]
MNAPFFHLAVGLLTGILLSSPLTSPAVKAAWGVLGIVYLACLLRDRKSRRVTWMASAALAAGLFLPHVSLPWRTPPAPLPSGRVNLYGRVDAPLEGGRRTDRLYLRMERAVRGEKTVPLSGRARLGLYWPGAGLKYGDRVRVRRVRLHRPKGFGNPGGFDYETHLAARGIFAVGGVSRPSQIDVLERDAGSPLLSRLYAFREREYILDLFEAIC